MNLLAEVHKIDEENPSNKKRILELSENPDSEIRMFAVEKFYPFNESDTAQRRLFVCLSDSDELVRVAALEIIEEWGCFYDVTPVLKCLSDDEWLVRGAAAMAIARVCGNEAIPNIINALDASVIDDEKVRCLAALILLNEKSSLDKFLMFLENEDYRVRCAVVNIAITFLSYIDEEYLSIRLLDAFQTRIKVEKTVAVYSSLSNAVRQLGGAECRIQPPAKS